VERPEITETTALGAATLAALGAGLVPDLDAAAQLWNLEREFLPAMPVIQREELLLGWRRAVERALL
jgi:glycerol kinase